MTGDYARQSNARWLLVSLFGSYFSITLVGNIGYHFLFIISALSADDFLAMVLISLLLAAVGSIATFYIVWYGVIANRGDKIPESIILAAHQLRAPATGVKWALGSLLSSPTLPPNDKELITQSFESISQVVEMVSGLLNAAQLEQSDSLAFKETDIVSLAGAAMKDLTLRAEQKKVKLKLDNQSGRNEIKAPIDADKIFIVFSNLIDNAIRYSRDGGAVTVVLNADDKKVSVVVRDSGIGIPKNDQYKIFSKFYRASNAVSTEKNGSGIGLYMTKNIIERHGGRLWFESAEGKGTAFFFTLPLIHGA